MSQRRSVVKQPLSFCDALPQYPIVIIRRYNFMTLSHLLKAQSEHPAKTIPFTHVICNSENSKPLSIKHLTTDNIQIGNVSIGATGTSPNIRHKFIATQKDHSCQNTYLFLPKISSNKPHDTYRNSSPKRLVARHHFFNQLFCSGHYLTPGFPLSFILIPLDQKSSIISKTSSINSICSGLILVLICSGIFAQNSVLDVGFESDNALIISSLRRQWRSIEYR